MKNLLKSEELLQFLASIALFSTLDYAWWVFPALLFIPDVSMLGYLISPRWGAYTYNIGHHKGLAVALGVAGLFLHLPALELTGLMLFAHASFDRLMGYGLKHTDAFKHTHLGLLA
ncbi:MAG: DUF4260 domain-containing protein [Sphingobacteriaceae bacterium]|nr:DUF4260 domain-containing protein [Cytophagaceae bacterium]